MKYIYTFSLLFFLLFFTRQLYLFSWQEGNLIIHLQNDHNIKDLHVNVFLDDKCIYKGLLDDYSLSPKRISLNESLGKHKISIKGKKITESYDFYLLQVTWICINFYSDVLEIEKRLSIPITE